MINDYTPPYARTIYQHIEAYNQIRTKVYSILCRFDYDYFTRTTCNEINETIIDMDISEEGILEVCYCYEQNWLDGRIFKTFSFPAKWLQLTGAELEEAIGRGWSPKGRREADVK